MSSIYQEIILDHYRNPHNMGSLAKATSSVSVNNPLCGDELEMYILEENDSIKEIAFGGKGCAISIASASMLTDYAKGKTKEDLKKIDKDFITGMLGIELSPNRLKCALLPMEALLKLVVG